MQSTKLKQLLTSISLAGLLAGITAETQAAFSISASKSAGGTLTHYTVDTDAGLVFKVRAYDNKSSTQSAGDIQSLIYNGVEYTSQSRGTQINSGFDWIWTVPVAISAVDVKAELVDANGNATPVTIPGKMAKNICQKRQCFTPAKTERKKRMKRFVPPMLAYNRIN